MTNIRPYLLFAAAALSAAALASVRLSAVAAASTGTLAGAVRLEGTPPKRMPISMAKEPSCAAMHGAPALNEDVVTDAHGALQNVIVFISEGLPDHFPDAPPQPVTLVQKGCTYSPHVIAVQANQKLQIINADKTSHNIHPLPANNREWNKSQPPGVPPFEESFAREEIAIPVKCNVHPWMRAYIAVFRHPYFAVTSEAGSFTIPNVPPGSYTITAWHEKLGKVTQKVTLAAGETKPVEFILKAKPY